MVKAFVLINTEAGGKEEKDDTTQKLKELKGIEEAHLIYGVHDIIAKIGAKNLAELREIISNRVRKVDGVYSTETLVVM